MLDRENLAEIKQEAQFKSQAQSIRGADFVVTGDIAEFGRKEVGDRQLFGILGRGKEQIAYAKVTLNIVNSLTSEVVYSAGGAGEYTLSNREVVGFGGTAGYDATLNGKVLDLAMIYLRLGRFDEAKLQLESEKASFPESSPYMDFLLKRMTAPKS